MAPRATRRTRRGKEGGVSEHKSDRCEWNPTMKRGTWDGDDRHDDDDAVWSVGKSPSWHLCDNCARLPEFKRYRVRTWIGPKELKP